METILKPIRNELDYKQALDELRGIFNFPKGTAEYDRAEVLEILIENYEEKHFHIENPDPIEAIKYLMEENDINQTELGKILGDKSKASLILNRKRKLSITMIRNLNTYLKIPLNILVNDYKLLFFIATIMVAFF